jgi:putative endonuclease
MPSDPRQSLGILGESLACAELCRRGYVILARRYRTRVGEIDIVARDGDATVFIEVKARDGNDFGDGAESVTPWKQRRVAKMAMDFLARHRLHDRPCRFDVVAVDVSSGTPRVEVYVSAFDAGGS